ncbi:MAG: tetratricopeptide repeat protein [Calditrichaceae bacterium]|nr:tetratricopeptide repeat protein [Calditrichaceae bacterium]
MFETRAKPIEIPERQKLNLLYDRYRPQYENILRKTVRKINRLLIHTNIETTIKYRLKSFNSFFNKMSHLRNGGNKPVAINDFIGIRVICPFLEDLSQVEQIIADNFIILEVERKGEKNSFREFSYDSIHLLIDIEDEFDSGNLPHTRKVCEIQLRTILQEAWAEVEHELIYKANFSLLNESIKRKLASLNASLTLSDIIFQEIRDYQKEIESRRQKCRTSIEEKIEIPSDIFIMDPSFADIEETQQVYKNIPIKPKSELERLLFDALEEHSNNNFEAAIEIYTSILRMKPKSHVRSIIYNHRGMAYFSLSEYAKSLKDFSRALEYNPKNTRILNNRGLAYRMIKQFSYAIEDLNQSLDIDEYQHETLHQRALVYYDLQDYGKAIEDCDKALELETNYEPAKNLKSILVSKL